mmetsp:Transcript_5294/g.8155  ORF Transcript_5294/g.8155 Transcript_5294/m.8155 type:complete len:91 (-) Transcript_5294:1041-1313(-)
MEIKRNGKQIAPRNCEEGFPGKTVATITGNVAHTPPNAKPIPAAEVYAVVKVDANKKEATPMILMSCHKVNMNALLKRAYKITVQNRPTT